MKQGSNIIELSRPLRVDKIPMGGIEEKIVASPLEREALVKRFGLVDLARLEAVLNVDHAEGKMLAVTGDVVADVVQECVVTLEPVASTVKVPVDVLFAPKTVAGKETDGPLADTGEADFPEPIENGQIDLGELAAQHLAVGLDPYPRKQGAVFDGYQVGVEDEAEKNPFLKLRVLIDNDDKTRG